MKAFYVAANLFALAVALPSKHERTPSPSVSVLNATFIGNVSNGIESFYGIPYAQPPLGPLRLRRAQAINSYASQTIQATATPTACTQLAHSNSSSYAMLLQGEDCLTVNIQRPSNLNSSAQLPVLFWIFGGGFEVGSTQGYDGTGLVETSMQLGHPIVFVAVNYRVSAFGFLGGREVQQAGISNLGLHDQRLAMQWVQDNIAAFGGDPTRVTIMGESAGSLSTFDHTVINGGNNSYKGKPLFRGAIMNSGTIIPTDLVNSTQAQAIYNQIVSEAGCDSSSNTLECLRNLPYDQLRTAVNTVPNYFSYSSLALPFMPRPDPTDSFFPVSGEVAIQAGNFTRVPTITGNQQDEGTLFSMAQTNLTTTQEVVDYLRLIYPNSSQSLRQGLVDTYPDDPTAGAPFGTGSQYQLYPQYKRLSAMLGDVAFTLRRRQYLSTVATNISTWSYLDSHRFGESAMGTYHSSDIEAIFNTNPIFPPFFGPVPAQTFRSYYVSFVNYLDPNTIGTSTPLVYWPRYTTWDPVLLSLRSNGNTLIQDDFRNSSAEYLSEHASELLI